jgi:hypothetical protein
MVHQSGRNRIVVTVATLALAAVGSQACGGASQQTPPAELQAPAPEPAVSEPAPPETSGGEAAEAAVEESPEAAAAETAPAEPPPPAEPPAPAYSGPPPYVNLRPARVGAGLTTDQITRLWRRTLLPAVTTCYTNQLATNPRAHGVLSTRIEVIAGGMGTVGRTTMAPANEAIVACVRDALGRVEWPAPRNQPSTEVNLQIDLAPTAPAPRR